MAVKTVSFLKATSAVLQVSVATMSIGKIIIEKMKMIIKIKLKKPLASVMDFKQVSDLHVSTFKTPKKIIKDIKAANPKNTTIPVPTLLL